MYPLGTWGIKKVLSGVWGVPVMEGVGVSADGVKILKIEGEEQLCNL